jgi:phosphoribosylformylglycinamidine synthase I
LKVAIIVFPGSNCDHDVYYVFKKILMQDTHFVWHKEVDLKGYQAIVLPGGFSYGDYLRCGAISRFSPIMKEVVRQAKKGVKIIGICNGFQILTESGLLPGALLKNDHQKFVCKTVYLKVENNKTGFTHLCARGELLRIPVAHGEGNYYCDEQTLKHLGESGQIVFKYASSGGEINNEANPNGSLKNIAGIINKEGNILGMMPHPERRSEEILGHNEGRKILQSMVENFTGN